MHAVFVKLKAKQLAELLRPQQMRTLAAGDARNFWRRRHYNVAAHLYALPGLEYRQIANRVGRKCECDQLA